MLIDLKRFRYTISREKLQFYISTLKIIGFICNAIGRYLEFKGYKDSQMGCI